MELEDQKDKLIKWPRDDLISVGSVGLSRFAPPRHVATSHPVQKRGRNGMMPFTHVDKIGHSAANGFTATCACCSAGG